MKYYKSFLIVLSILLLGIGSVGIIFSVSEKFVSPNPTFNLNFLREPNATQKIIKPIYEKIFPTGFIPKNACQYPEQCPNPTTLLWGATAITRR